MPDLTVACVLNTSTDEDRWGGAKNTGACPYTPDYVFRLREKVAEHLEMDHTFTVLTDLRQHFAGCNTRWLEHDWPGWWAKIELFRPGLFTGRVLYFDLDTDIVGPLDEIASYSGPFAMIDDWLHEWMGASGVMAWVADDPLTTESIYEPFCRNPEGAMESHRGDQNWIHGSLDWEPLRQLFPGQIVSRWEECERQVPDNARVVCWHGSPKPHEVDWKTPGSRKTVKREVA